LTVKSDKPVVFTAAMRPASAISADGARAAWTGV
ncbi:asparaginase, partial [Salmonella enterica subsp. enterica]|nr:asparaginase [Salmonella enterica subsp. enterica]EBQ0576842.1 asparaginase [Salmonella enterica subsp. enterica]EBW4037860.1 asparaginase [Salmonella enterica subsp. enterica serovar Kentucky]ELN0751595.1 asparaginase [Salmonella enterica]HBW2709485.1 asparaginase [Salmonella enterica]